jgi:Ca2+-binding RTX toxin-like protein
VLTGGGGNDRLYAGNGSDQLLGGAGNDLLDGDFGIDVLNGDVGDDTYVLGNDTGDTVNDAAGIDTITSTITRSLAAFASIENLTLLGTGAIDGTGNNLLHAIVGNTANNVLNGGVGADTMTGNAGDDRYFVDNAADRANESAGQGSDTVIATVSYVLVAATSVEVLRTLGSASTYAVNLVGNELANSIQGNAATNLLVGKSGNDTIFGNGGTDTFFFDTALGASNVDTIVDYNVAQDTIWLNDTVFTGLSMGTLAAGAFRIGAAAVDADDRIIYNSATGELIFDSNGNAAGGATQFAVLSTGLALTNLDFEVV